jgi:uncharacterized protein
MARFILILTHHLLPRRNKMARESNLNGTIYNRLIHEKSPYLLQHAANPVDWHPWGEEAFNKARSEEKLIFLSIGYATCHWCHVMERESFEDPEVADLLNEVFVPIKVDREERPDVDGIYMTVCQMLTGSGGWPLTVVMTPEKKPLFAGTYIPKHGRFGRPGLMELIPEIRSLWQTRRVELLKSAEQITEKLRQVSVNEPGTNPTEAMLHSGYENLASHFDTRHGGFGDAPKFPTPHNFFFLLRYARRQPETQALEMVERTLQAMRLGGIYDHVGFGFHRYSTDNAWLLPHFEKMLYDQAMLTLAYTEAFQLTGKEEYRKTAREILTYVLRDMTSQEGGFFSAEDADSEGEEGKFYVWTEEELEQVLGREDAKLIGRIFNTQPAGNFHEEASGESKGNNILHLKGSIEELARDSDIDSRELSVRVESARTKLFEARQKRIRPLRDDKVLADWNGLMIAALARAAQCFDEPAYKHAAVKAMRFVLDGMRDADGRLLRRFRDGETSIRGNLDDYAFITWGLIELYELTFDVAYLREALTMTRDLITHFWDHEQGGFYFTPDDGEELLVRKKEIYDGAIPSGNSVAMLNLLRLSRITGDADLEERASQVATAFSRKVEQFPGAFTQLLAAVDFALGPTREVVIVGRPEDEETQKLVGILRSRFLPNMVAILRPVSDEAHEITRLAPYVKTYAAAKGRATAYVCSNNTCQLPTTDGAEMLRMLGA